MHIHKQSALQTTLALLSVLDKMIPEQNLVVLQTLFVIISETFKGTIQWSLAYQFSLNTLDSKIIMRGSI